jgi:hypothetical protein
MILSFLTLNRKIKPRFYPNMLQQKPFLILVTNGINIAKYFQNEGDITVIIKSRSTCIVENYLAIV